MDWAIGGVNTSSTAGGPACRNYMSDSWRFVETIFITAFAVAITAWGYNRLKLPKSNSYPYQHDAIKTFLLIVFSIALGVEIGFKLASRTVIYLLNPCHVMTVMQLYLLAAPPSNKVTAIFRVHLNLLNGPVLAYIFPETDNRRLPFEKWIYWVQHSLLAIVPFYLLRQGGVYNVEPLRDVAWVTFSYGLVLIYHFLILQPFGLPIGINLNHMLCPADADPFAGPYYRLAATIHQAILCPLLCKLACWLLASSINDPTSMQLIPVRGSPYSREKNK